MSPRNRADEMPPLVVFDEAKWREKTLSLVTRFGLTELHSDYVGFEVECWKCHASSPYFLWPGIRDRFDPPQPPPLTVKRRFSKTVQETYPSNGCIACDALFGEWFIFDTIFDYVDYEEGAELVDRFLNMTEPPEAESAQTTPTNDLGGSRTDSESPSRGPKS
jgi:hypothetical protein